MGNRGIFFGVLWGRGCKGCGVRVDVGIDPYDKTEGLFCFLCQSLRPFGAPPFAQGRLWCGGSARGAGRYMRRDVGIPPYERTRGAAVTCVSPSVKNLRFLPPPSSEGGEGANAPNYCRGIQHPKKIFQKFFPSVVHFKATEGFFIPIGRETYLFCKEVHEEWNGKLMWGVRNCSS